MSRSSLVNATKRLILTLVFILTLSLPSWSQHTTWIGKVMGVSDGDTITVLHDGKAEKIRLYGIDCPEKGQAFGKRAKQFTSKMVFGKVVEARPITTDRYGRTIAWIYCDGACLNEELLKVGLAWHYKWWS
jgi:endonuclease YncB( thermonuclease family)